MNQSYRPSPEFEKLLDAMCDGNLTADQSRRLEEIVADDDDALLHYLCQIHLHGTLHWNIAQPAHGEDVPASRHDGRLSGDLDNPPPPEPTPLPIIIDLNSSDAPPSISFQSFIAGPVFSYMAALLILGVMIFGASIYKISTSRDFAGSPSDGGDIASNSVPEFIGRITDADDCRLADDQASPIIGSYIPLDRTYNLTAGLLEITYDSGAKVILEGPCEYNVISKTSGFLALGKMTARVEKNDELGIRNDESSGRKSDIHHSSFTNHRLFAIHTPSAVITDLGTEFGVEVDDAGGCLAHVFEGRVEIKPRDAKHADRTIALTVGQSARVERNAESSAIARVTANPKRFARHMPYRGPIHVHSTGTGLMHGDVDPHWEITQAVGHPGFEPQAALVTAVSTRYFRRNIPERSQWISTGDMLPILPEDATYTFRTTFEIGGRPSRTLALRGGFAADNHVEAIRINGVSIPVSQHDYTPPYQQLIPFLITDGFVEGTNVLELDVRNGDPKTEPRSSRMLLLVELEVFTNRRKEPRQEPQNLQRPNDGGKEDAR